MRRPMMSDSYRPPRPSSPPFLKMRVRKGILTVLATTSVVVIAVSCALLSMGSTQVISGLTSPDVIIFIFTCFFLMQLFMRGHYWRLAGALKVGEGLALHLSILLVVTFFVGFRLFARN